ncbi:acyl-CoA dehydrogenase family protein [Salinispora arenicola]|uniref:Acyl-CoA dehydrogenase n=1 Tax=Salinispora arenicola TaxID=168697 RepID=A0A542XTA4_SALAC|nr:acyl-CoA dehydrogenase family protein [Salinispora arenicola]MCN0151975.1 acyl-CoA dehydrogenase family protein [Salinispora arenicola]TQL39070.1 alkylation response protein AidB-like acyl-CoA dehydrogenase [Salinispora arenicola]GIM86889.1 acyl-CoA dehydrogenase [Salinispora arenicola]
MRLVDTDDEAAFRATLRQWLRDNLPAGVPHSWDTEQRRAWSRRLHTAGYAGITWPREHGGRGLSPSYQAVYAEESALAGAPDHVNVIGIGMVGPTLIRLGSPEQQQAFLPRILSGEVIFSQGFSEPDAGSDLASVRTLARRHPDGWVLDGEKVWSSYAHLADYCLLLARTDEAPTRHRGLTCFLLDMRAPGVQVRPLRQMSGDTDFNQILLDSVVVPADAVLGEVGAGWRVAMTTLAHERGTFGITLTSRLAAELGRLVETVRAVGASDCPIVRREIAQLHIEVQALRYTGYRALTALERTGTPGPESSVLKLRWSLANQRLATLAVRVLDGRPGTDDWYGYWRRQLLRSRTNTIEGGTSEILRGIVAERVLGLPRSH